MASKTEVVVFNHDFEGESSQVGGPTAANPELAYPPLGYDDALSLENLPNPFELGR